MNKIKLIFLLFLFYLYIEDRAIKWHNKKQKND